MVFDWAAVHLSCLGRRNRRCSHFESWKLWRWKWVSSQPQCRCILSVSSSILHHSAMEMVTKPKKDSRDAGEWSLGLPSKCGGINLNLSGKSLFHIVDVTKSIPPKMAAEGFCRRRGRITEGPRKEQMFGRGTCRAEDLRKGISHFQSAELFRRSGHSHFEAPNFSSVPEIHLNINFKEFFFC